STSPGQGQKDLIQARLSIGEGLDLDGSVLQYPQRLRCLGCVVQLDGQRSVISVPSDICTGGAEEGFGGFLAVGGICDAHSEGTGPHLGFQLSWCAFGDHLAVVDDGDSFGEPVSLFEVLGGEQDRGSAVDQ